MAELGRVCGPQADLFRAILARISHLNKLPLQRIAMTLTRMHATDTCLAVATP
jgi:hypothetical protein